MKINAKRIVLIAITALLLAIMIAGNMVLSYFSPLIHQVFAGNTVDYDSEEVQRALAKGNELVMDLAEDSMVLLRNENSVLPLKATDKINLFGWNSTDLGFMLTGGGSGGTLIGKSKKVTLTQALDKEGMEYNKTLMNAYVNYNNSYDADANSVATNRLVNPPASFYTDELMQSAKDYSDVAVVVLSRYATENGGSNELVDIEGFSNGTYLSPSKSENDMLDAVCAKFDKVIVLLNTCNNMSLAFLEDKKIDGAIYVGLPGQSGARAIPKILRGEVNPSGRLTDTYAFDSKAYDPTYANVIKQSNSINYAEGIYFGYKWYETAGVEGYFNSVDNKYGKGYDGVVQYPFGYGLSYSGTNFSWDVVTEGTTLINNSEMEENSKYTVNVRVTNNGDREGKEVVQLYATPPYTKGGIEKAHVNLLAFAKTSTLKKGESQVVKLNFTAYDMASYDDYDANNNGFTGYELEEGNYEIKLMNNSHEINKSSTSKFNLVVKEEIAMILDPTTEEIVENRFTGSTAYAGVPIDGSNVHSSVKYMTRANFKDTFPKTRTASPNNAARINAASTFQYSEKNVPTVTQGVAGDLRLVMKEDGSFASENDLNGKNSGVKLKYNDDLLTKLANYDAPEWDNLLNQLSTAEIKELIRKGGFTTTHLTSVGKPNFIDKDGPAGFNDGVTNADIESQWTAYPVEALIGCSWNQMLAYDMGRVQGLEATATGLSGWYAPGVNLHRSAYNSRNFEYYSEDAHLSGKMAAELIRGAKQNNLYCYIKHFAASEAGQNPNELNTWLTEQTLREIYLKPFEIAVKQGGANAIMSAFNRVGATWAGGSYALDTEVLRDEWGFRGTMITDWYAPYAFMDYNRGVTAGNDLWLNMSSEASRLNMNDKFIAYRARISAKNIMYTFVDTYVTARDYLVNGDPNDPYKNTIDLTITKQPFSPLFVTLWVGLDVLLVGGMAVCVLFFFRKKKDKVVVTSTPQNINE